jgi:hypothetical protein
MGAGEDRLLAGRGNVESVGTVLSKPTQQPPVFFLNFHRNFHNIQCLIFHRIVGNTVDYGTRISVSFCLFTLCSSLHEDRGSSVINCDSIGVYGHQP